MCPAEHMQLGHQFHILPHRIPVIAADRDDQIFLK